MKISELLNEEEAFKVGDKVTVHVPEMENQEFGDEIDGVIESIAGKHANIKHDREDSDGESYSTQWPLTYLTKR